MLPRHAARVSGAAVRTLVLTLFVILGVVFSGTHASAFQHSDEGASTIVQAGMHSHVDADHHDDGKQGSDQKSSDVGTHNHCSMDRAVSSTDMTCPQRVTSGAIRPPTTRALSSLDQVPPLEPPSA